MSTLSYQLEYQQILADLTTLQQEDAVITSVRIPSDAKGRNAFFVQFWLSIYLRYLRLAQRLAVVQEVEQQPQKLHDVRTLLTSCIGRMLETKAHITANSGDVIAFDNLLLDEKMTPDEAEVPLPSYMLEDRKDELQQRRNYVLSLQAHYADTDPEAPVSVAQRNPAFKSDPTRAMVPMPSKKAGTDTASTPGAQPSEETDAPMPVEEAVSLLQTCERGRQARQRAKFQMAIFRQQQEATRRAQEYNNVSGKDRAATVVQKVVQGYLARRRAVARYEKEKTFLGMTATPEIRSDEQRIVAQQSLQERKARQAMNVAEMRQKTLEMESNLKSKEGPKKMEEMLDEILMHMSYARLENKDGALVELPPPEEGGSLQLLNRSERRRSTNAAGGRKSTTGGRSRSTGGSVSATSKPGDARGRESRSSSVASRGKDDEGPTTLPASAQWKQMAEGAERFQSEWRDKFVRTYVENGELDQKVDEQVLRQQLLEGPQGVMAELRKCVDQLVMMEVDNLKERMAADKKSKKKKPKKEKKPKKPKLKDPTKGVSLETSTNTAIFENKLQVPPPTRLGDFLGGENVMAGPLDVAMRTRKADEETKKKWQKIIRSWNEDVEAALGMKKEAFEALFEQYLKQSGWLSDPSAADLRRAVSEYGVLPLGSQIIHDLAPSSRTLCFYGFPATGKTLMAYALCNEAGANFFNLSPGNFAVTKGLAKTIQLVFYLARMKGPSVIYIDDVDKIFPEKKAAKKKDALRTRGKKMKKPLLKAMSTLQPTDRVLVLGCTSQPWLADPAAIASAFEHALYFPLPDYATRMALLKGFVAEKLPPSVSSATTAEVCEQVALLTDNYSTGQLKQVVSRTLHPRRVQQLAARPLDATDFVPALSVTLAVKPDEVAQMKAFQAALPFTHRRANPEVDFKVSEEEAKKRKSTAKKKSTA